MVHCSYLTARLFACLQEGRVLALGLLCPMKDLLQEQQLQCPLL